MRQSATVRSPSLGSREARGTGDRDVLQLTPGELGMQFPIWFLKRGELCAQTEPGSPACHPAEPS